MPSDFTQHSDKMTAEFLADHPEHAEEFGYHQKLGPVMSTKGVRLFADWVVKKKGVKPEKAKRMIEIMDEVNENLKGGTNAE